MTTTVTVLDYGVGNLHSIARALRRIGARAVVTGDPDVIAGADLVILPGVGAFGHCANNLRAAGMVDPIRQFVGTGKPFLSICVGMQLLFDRSSEFGTHQGLGLIPGSVDIIPTRDGKLSRKVPHIGWGTLELSASRMSWANTAMEALAPGHSAAYFVHSYSARPADPRARLADVDYEGFAICAAVQWDNICGLQFHPEMSGAVGLTVLEAFVT